MAAALHSLTSAESLAHRARIASFVSSLRPLGLRTPVCNLLAHRIPTRWSLYRGLLRDAPSDDVRSRIRTLFQKHKGLRKASMVKRVLARYHKMRDMFAAAKAGEPRSQAIVERYARMVAFCNEKARNDRLAQEMLAWRDKLAKRPIMTGIFLRATIYHGPLPRLKPQPKHISGLIGWRRKQRERRIDENRANEEQLMDMQCEVEQERALAERALQEGQPFKSEFVENADLWLNPMQERADEFEAMLARDEERARTPFPPALTAQIMAARREKIANKTRELQRERAGVVLKRTLRRRRQGPPAHILTKLSEEEKHLDQVSRSVSEVGYVGMVKRRLGFKLRDPEAYKVELGNPKEMERLEREAAEIEAENERRRREDIAMR